MNTCVYRRRHCGAEGKCAAYQYICTCIHTHTAIHTNVQPGQDSFLFSFFHELIPFDTFACAKASSSVVTYMYMYTCVSIYIIHTHTAIHTCTWIHPYQIFYTYTYSYSYIHTYMYMITYVYVYGYIRIQAQTLLRGWQVLRGCARTQVYISARTHAYI